MAGAEPSHRREWLWCAAVLAAVSPLLFNLLAAMWRTPYPIGETVALLEDYVDVSPLAFFDPSTRAWYRPLYHLTWWTFLRGSGSLDGALFLFRCLEITAVATLVVLFVRHLRPRTLLEGAAATCAVAILVGAPAFRENLPIPLLMTLVGMPLALIVWMLLERDRRWWHGPAIVVLTLAAIGFKEQGLVIVPVVAAAWWAGSPGATRGTAAAVVLVGGAYLALRLATSGTWHPFEQDVALGFDVIPAAEANVRFGAFPLWVHLYNGASTVANVLFSEPTDGQFKITLDLTRGEYYPWEINHVVSSLALTGLMVWWGVGVMRRNAGAPWSLESRVVIVTVLIIAASGALSFNYARDRLGGMAIVFYAIAAYHAIRAAGARAARASVAGMAVAGVALLILAAAWQIRAIGTVEDVRMRAEKARREWITDLQERRTRFAGRANYLRILTAMTNQGLDPDSARRAAYPEWARVWLGNP